MSTASTGRTPFPPPVPLNGPAPAEGRLVTAHAGDFVWRAGGAAARGEKVTIAVGMLVAGRASDRFGAPRISAIWFALTAAGVFLLSVRMPLGVTFLVVLLTGVFLNSAQTMIYATVSIGSAPAHRATAVGWTSGMGRFGAVFGPWLGGRLLAADRGDWGFTAFALAGTASMVFIGVAALRTARSAERDGLPRRPAVTG